MRAPILALIACAGCTLHRASDLVPPTVDEDASLPAVAFNGSRFHVITEGDADAPTVVFLHSGPGASLFGLLPFRDAYDGHSLADDFQLVFWDQRGAGLSRRHGPDEISWDRYLQDLDQLVDRFSPDAPVHLVAFSFGGTYAVSYADAYPDKVAGLVLISPAPISGALYAEAPFTDGRLSEGTSDILWSHQYLGPNDHARLDYLFAASAMDGLHPDFRVSLDRWPTFHRWGAVSQWMLYLDLGLIPPPSADRPPPYDFTARLDQLTAPVLAFVGGDDAMFSAAFERRQLAHFAAAELVSVPGWGHDVAFAYDQLQPKIRAHLLDAEAQR